MTVYDWCFTPRSGIFHLYQHSGGFPLGVTLHSESLIARSIPVTTKTIFVRRTEISYLINNLEELKCLWVIPWNTASRLSFYPPAYHKLSLFRTESEGVFPACCFQYLRCLPCVSYFLGYTVWVIYYVRAQ